MKEKAIKTLGRLEATVSVPGSKSYTQRALAIATLAQGRSRLRNILLSEDTHLLIEALRSLGASIELDGVEATVTGTGGAIKNPLRALHLGNNGTGMRLLTALVSLGRGGFLLGGDPRLCERPVDTLLSALQALGVRARSEREDGCPPVAIDAHGLPGGNVILKNIASSQFISALLIAAPYSDQGIGIELRGKVVSMPYVDMTLAVMKEFGVAAETRRRRYYFVRGAQRYVARDYLVEGDVSGASYFFLAAALCGGRVRILNINPKTRQGDLGILKIMAAMGCSVRKGNGWIEITGGNLYGGDHAIDMADMPDMVPTLARALRIQKGENPYQERISPQAQGEQSHRIAGL